MKQFVRFSIGHTVLFNLVFVVLIVVGFYSLLEIPVERYPNVHFGKVLISAYYPGASPQDVEALVTEKIEDSLKGLEFVEFIRSTSYKERSTILVKFIDDTDYEALYKELRFRVLGILDELPPEVEPPAFNDINTLDWLPVISINLLGERSNRALSLVAKDMEIPLRQIPGVFDVELAGEYVREFHIVLDSKKMSSLGVTFDQVDMALKNTNVSYPAGSFNDPSGEFSVRVDEKFRSRDDVLSVIIRADKDGSYLRLFDVASDAMLSYRDPFVISSLNGKDSVTLKVLKTNEGNALKIKDNVMEVLKEFQPVLEREGIEVALTQDSTIYIKDSMHTLGWNLVAGMVLVFLIIYYFMGFRNACLTTIGIPFSFLATIVIMYLTKNSLNEITLFSFVLVSGIIVDDAIVVLENIYRYTQKGLSVKEAITEGTSEVMLPVISATSTTVAAFLPMLIMTGATGEFFAQIPKAVSYALLASLFECFFILTIHYLDFGPRPVAQEKACSDTACLAHSSEPVLLHFLRKVTELVVGITLRYRLWSLIAVTVAFFISIGIIVVSITGILPLIRIKFFPDDYNLYYVELEGPSPTPIEGISERLKKISRFIMKEGQGMADSASGFAGFYVNEDYEQVFGNNLGTVLVTLPEKEKRAFADPVKHLESMRQKIEERFEKDGFKIRVRPEKDGPPVGKDITVRLLGTNFKSVEMLSKDIRDFLKTAPDIGPYLIDLDDDQGNPARILRFRTNNEKILEHGLSVSEAASLAASILDGRYIGKFRLADEEIDMKLRIKTPVRPGDALQIPLIEHASGPIRLADIVSLQVYEESSYIKHYQRTRAITLSANLKPGSPTSTPAVIRKIKKYYEDIQTRYPGAVIDFGGEFETTNRSYTSLAYAFGIAVLIIYIILATQFRSYLQPLIILSAVIFSIIGVVFGKLVTQSLFTINSFIAVVGVTGVVVNDSLVLIDFINRAYRKGLSRREAIEEGIRVRLRPILLTTFTTSLGLLPMALGIPSYSLTWGAMASTFVTGLAASTALTLFIVPVQWDLLEEWKARHKKE